jgi:small subunit ribosomal protein S1
VVGQVLRGTVTKVVPFGVFVRVADGVEGLMPFQELAVPAEELQVGAEVLVAVASVNQEQRKLGLSQRGASAGSPGRDRRTR